MYREGLCDFFGFSAFKFKNYFFELSLLRRVKCLLKSILLVFVLYFEKSDCDSRPHG